MNLNRLQGQHDVFVAVLFQHGFLDDQFKQLHELENESPHFVEELLTMFFNQSEKCINNIAQALQQRPVDFKMIYEYFHQLKGSSGVMFILETWNHGVMISKIACKDFTRCMKCLQELQNESSLFKSNLQNLFKLQQEIVAAGGTIPKIQ